MDKYGSMPARRRSQCTNDTVIKMANTQPATALLIFFGGDVQNRAERMSPDHKDYTAWSLEAVVDRLSTAMPTCDVCAIVPSRVERQTFSCYDNFVASNNVGAPTHCFDPYGKATLHLAGLLK
jgi:hypothetical protein